MEQEVETHSMTGHDQGQGDEHSHGGSLLGPILCWAVVFADIGTSVYYTPGILYSSVGRLAGFFVLLTMSVFVLLTLKYTEVTHRFPQGGGVVTVAAQALNSWVGALGGMFILVDYFLTAAISCLSGIQYFSVVFPLLGPSIVLPVVGPIQLLILVITIAMLVLLGILNWIGISESAKVSLVGAVIAFVSDLAILVTVFTHLSFGQFLDLFTQMFAHQRITPVFILIGFAGSFLAFSGLESISQLSPVMRIPRKKVAGIAMLLVILTIGLTSPLLTMLSTLLLPNAAKDQVLSGQIISLLGGKWGGQVLETEVAISAGSLLVFASNTAIIGAYHVFMALSRMDFFPAFVLRRNRLRGTPHYSIALATGIPIIVLLIVLGNINLLGDMYAFGLLGAFTLTCLGLDVVRYRERRAARSLTYKGNALENHDVNEKHEVSAAALSAFVAAQRTGDEHSSHNGHAANGAFPVGKQDSGSRSYGSQALTLWSSMKFYLGVLTTALVMIAWSTNLVAKPLATAFGGTVATIGMAVAFFNYSRHKRGGRIPVMITGVEGRIPGSLLAVLTSDNGHNDAVIRAAINNAGEHAVVFLYVSERQAARTPGLFEVVDPYLDDLQAKEYFGKAESLAQKAKVNRRFVYTYKGPGVVANVWQKVHPRDIVVAAKNAAQLDDINPDRIRFEITSSGKVAHMLKQW